MRTILRPEGGNSHLSGSEQGAGGVGGLLSVSDHGTPYMACYDGNGNIIAWMDANGQIAGRQDYDPFGNRMIEEGVQIPLGFSTKYEDRETGLLYYGYRYYSPSLGRWISKDPIEERGGVNLYGFVGNDGVNAWDLLGMIVIGIDGTWENADGSVRNSNGSNTKRFVDAVSGEKTVYYPGPGGTATGYDRLYAGLTGAGSIGIKNKALRRICQAYCDGDCNIGLVGWSRGAVIAMGVAAALNEQGCNCNGRKIKPIRVRFVGLFDAVQMMSGGWPQSVPRNVVHFAHAKKTDGSQWIFPTKNYDGNSRSFDLLESRIEKVQVCFGSLDRRRCYWVERRTTKSTHGDIGDVEHATRAYDWIVEQASSAGIHF